MSRKINEKHIRQVVKKTWLLFCQWEKSQHSIDYGVYVDQRALAERALDLAPKTKSREEWKKEFPLP